MKKIRYIILVFCFISCNSESVSDCFQTEGSVIQEEFNLGFFNKIRIEDDVTLILKQASEQKIIIETGENLLNDVTVFIENETLVIQDNNGCNFIRDYGVTRAFINVPNLTEIRNSSSEKVIGEGLLQFPELKLVSNTTGNIEGTNKSGDFILQLECDNLIVNANGQSVFYISGTSNKARISFGDEWPRFEGENLIINDLYVFQRSAATMKVNPLEKITGEIRGTGNVISVHHPPIVEVEEFFSGTLIFQD